MENLCKKLMLGGSVAAMVAAISGTANAQEPAPQTEAVTVSASRINIQGYEAPTPVTVIGAAQTLQRDAKVDIGDAIRELPVGRWSRTRPATAPTRATPPRATPVSTLSICAAWA